ncbi:MAG: hypothetical protein P1R58_08645 [bacterium]|nr:hypothetical protein [bacterium]
MRKYGIICMGILVLLIGYGCTTDEEEGIRAAFIIDDSTHCICDAAYYTALVDVNPLTNSSTDSTFIWLGIYNAGSMVDSVGFMKHTGTNFHTFYYKFSVNAYDGLDPGDYQVWAYHCISESDVFNLDKVRTYMLAEDIEVPDFSSKLLSCSPCGCTPVDSLCRNTGIDKVAYYANLIGVEAKISAMYGQKMCGTSTDTTATASAAFIAVVYDTTYTIVVNNKPKMLTTIWGQMGFSAMRFSNDPHICNIRYSEVQGTTFYDRTLDVDNDGIPSQGSINLYTVELDPSTGQWCFYYDGIQFGECLSAPVWQNRLG